MIATSSPPRAPKYTLTAFKVAQGKILRQKREDLDLIRREVCEALWLSIPTLVNWEKGHNSPTCEDIARLAEFYQCTIQELFPSHDPSSTSQT